MYIYTHFIQVYQQKLRRGCIDSTLLYTAYIYMYIYNVYVRDRCKIRTVLQPSDGFEAGQTAAKRARRLRSWPDGFTTFH